jgi:mannosylglycerate hydrolase
MSRKSASPKPGYKVIVVSSTHWDREWYLHFQQFRRRLVTLMDDLLALLETKPAFRSFTLDGQTVVMEDYLEVRPENRPRLEKQVRLGRLFVGPWYVLPDEFLVSGESLIRNLLLGYRTADDLGRRMEVGYTPDPFGHIAQLPQILSGFGLQNIIFSRGLDDR